MMNDGEYNKHRAKHSEAETRHEDTATQPFKSGKRIVADMNGWAVAES